MAQSTPGQKRLGTQALSYIILATLCTMSPAHPSSLRQPLRLSHNPAHSLWLKFTVRSHSTLAQPRYVVQGSVDETPFLEYNSENNRIIPLVAFGEQVNTTKTWEELTQTLREVAQELRTILPDIKLLMNKTRDLPSLLATMLCQHKGEQCTAATWKFSNKSSVFLMFNAINRKWTVTDSRATRIKEKWEKDQDLMEFFRKTLLGDCMYWLRQFSELLEKAPAPTLTIPVTNQFLPTLTSPAIQQLLPALMLPVNDQLLRRVGIILAVFVCSFMAVFLFIRIINRR